MFTDAQFTALMTAVVTGLGGICTVVGLWLKGRAADRKERTRAILYEADSKIELATALAAQRAVLESILRWIQFHTPGAVPLEIERERTPVHAVPPLTPTQMRAFGRQDDVDSTPPERPAARRRSEVGPPRRTPGRGIRLSYQRPDSQHDEE